MKPRQATAAATTSESRSNAAAPGPRGAQTGTRAPPIDARSGAGAAPGDELELDLELDDPFASDVGELDAAPPLRGKVHPRSEISDVVPTLDDEVRSYRHHPNDAGAIEFEVNPDTADAAADLAGDLGAEFLEGATRGQDLSDVVMSRDDSDGDLAYLLEDERGAPAPDDEQPPTLRMRRRPPR